MLKNLFSKVKKSVISSGLAVVAILAAAVPAFASPPSTATDFSGMGGLDITPADVVSTGFSFMNMFGTYTTLVLGIIFAPVAIGFVLWLWGKLPRMGGKRA